MTKKIFWEDPYQTEVETHIASTVGPQVTLEETIFYPFSGGQESDTGKIGGYQVIEARKSGMEIEYTLPADHKLKINDSVTIQIDWERRYKLMRLHFAAELVLELVYKKLQGVEKIGAHISEDKARIDFNWPTSISPWLPEINAEAESIIQNNLEIHSAFSDAKNEKRYWEVAGFAKVPCGGTHLKKTGEVGAIRLKRKNIGKGKERVEIYLQEKS
jgi:alanyl-tRNA synthetase